MRYIFNVKFVILWDICYVIYIGNMVDGIVEFLLRFMVFYQNSSVNVLNKVIEFEFYYFIFVDINCLDCLIYGKNVGVSVWFKNIGNCYLCGV